MHRRFTTRVLLANNLINRGTLENKRSDNAGTLRRAKRVLTTKMSTRTKLKRTTRARRSKDTTNALVLRNSTGGTLLTVFSSFRVFSVSLIGGGLNGDLLRIKDKSVRHFVLDQVHITGADRRVNSDVKGLRRPRPPCGLTVTCRLTFFAPKV